MADAKSMSEQEVALRQSAIAAAAAVTAAWINYHATRNNFLSYDSMNEDTCEIESAEDSDAVVQVFGLMMKMAISVALDPDSDVGRV